MRTVSTRVTATNLGETLEEGVRNWFATLLVSAKSGCEWASENLRSHEELHTHTRDGFFKNRALASASHWRWVFGDSSDHVLPFALVCEELGLSENSVRRRIMAQCRENRDINQMVDRVLSQGEC